MQDLNDKVTGGTLTAAEWNQVPSELQNVIEALGITLSSGDLQQLGKAIAGYAAGGEFYTESGVADAYVLNVVGSKQAPPAYFDGMKARFVPGSTNTGASTVNVASLGVVDVVDEQGNPLHAGALNPFREVTIVYDAGLGDFLLLRPYDTTWFGHKDVRDFGATGDGSTDDTAAFVAAFALTAIRKTVVPPGTYQVSGITVPAGAELVLLKGANIRLIDSSDTHVVTLGGDGAVVHGLGTITGNAANQAASSSSGVFSDGNNDLLVDELVITDCEDRGVHILNGSRCTVARCNITLTGRMGIQGQANNTETLDDFSVLNCYVDRSDSAANDDGCIEVTGDSTAVSLARPLVRDSTVIMHTAPTGSNVVPIELFGPSTGGPEPLHHGRVTGCTVVGGSIGISIASGAVFCTVDSCTVEDVDNIGIELANCRDNVVSGCAVDGASNTAQGIVCNNNAGSSYPTIRNTIVGCVVKDAVDRGILVIDADTAYITISGCAMSGADSTADGIFVLNSGGHVNCVGNLVDLQDSTGTSERRGFVFNNSSNCTFVGGQVKNAHRAGQIVANNEAHSEFLVSQNDFTGCTNIDVQEVLQGSGTLTNVNVFQNLPSDINYLSTGNAVTLSAQTEVDFASITPNAERITILFDVASLSGTDHFLVQLGDSGGIETTGYSSVSGAQTSTSGFIIEVGLAAGTLAGQLVLTRIANTTWVASFNGAETNAGTVVTGGGRKQLSAVLDTVRVTRSGTDTLDAGTLNIFVE